MGERIFQIQGRIDVKEGPTDPQLVLLRVNPDGSSCRADSRNIPRNRILLMGLSYVAPQIYVAFPYSGDFSNGAHGLCQGAIMRTICSNHLRAVINGQIRPVNRNKGEKKGEKAKHKIEIYKKPNLQVPIEIELMEWEYGLICPEVYIDDAITQRLLTGLNADELEIVNHGDASVYFESYFKSR